MAIQTIKIGNEEFQFKTTLTWKESKIGSSVRDSLLKTETRAHKLSNEAIFLDNKLKALEVKFEANPTMEIAEQLKEVRDNSLEVRIEALEVERAYWQEQINVIEFYLLDKSQTERMIQLFQNLPEQEAQEVYNKIANTPQEVQEKEATEAGVPLADSSPS